jgi:hypothetical protein
MDNINDIEILTNKNDLHYKKNHHGEQYIPEFHPHYDFHVNVCMEYPQFHHDNKNASSL